MISIDTFHTTTAENNNRPVFNTLSLNESKNKVNSLCVFPVLNRLLSTETTDILFYCPFDIQVIYNFQLKKGHVLYKLFIPKILVFYTITFDIQVIYKSYKGV